MKRRKKQSVGILSVLVIASLFLFISCGGGGLSQEEAPQEGAPPAQPGQPGQPAIPPGK